MSFKSFLKAFKRALPVIVANAPAVIVAVREVKRAAKVPASKPPAM